MNEKYWWIICGAIAMFVIARLEHNLRRRRQRRCCECNHATYRIYQMIKACFGADVDLRFGQYYQTYTFSLCRCCKKVVLIKSDDKWFSFFELWWRKFTCPSQFRIDPTLFERAGLTGNSMPLEVQTLLFEQHREARDRKALRMFQSTPS